MRQYRYVQTISISPTLIGPLDPEEVATCFLEFAVHVLSQQDRGDTIPEDECWRHSVGYMRWFYYVSHPLIIAPAAVPKYRAHRPVYQEVIVEQERARHLRIHSESSTT